MYNSSLKIKGKKNTFPLIGLRVCGFSTQRRKPGYQYIESSFDVLQLNIKAREKCWEEDCTQDKQGAVNGSKVKQA